MRLPLRSITRKSTPLFFWTTVVVLAFFAVVETHELIPFLQMEFESDDPFQNAGVCPFCQIMFTLALAVFFLPFFLFRQPVRFRLIWDEAIPQFFSFSGLFDPRAPPFL
ncbi:MAG: hypothetical protein GX130_08295 [Candidatus Hydrogenedens sp.]|nr:hypothetical protein [Candidatus Hydrogenedens sp.]